MGYKIGYLSAASVPLCICGYTQDLVLSVETEHTFPLADPAVFMVLFLLLLQPAKTEAKETEESDEGVGFGFW